MKTLVNFIRSNAIALTLMATITTGLVYLNSYVLDMTRGCYNIIDVLFM